MYRLKEAFIIFWCVLTHKYYWFTSVKSDEKFTPGTKKKGHQFHSAELEDNSQYSNVFLKCNAELSTELMNKWNGKSKES